MMTYGEANGVIILTAKKLGYQVSYENEAAKLASKESIAAVFMGNIDAEATRLKSLIIKDGRIAEAQSIVSNNTYL